MSSRDCQVRLLVVGALFAALVTTAATPIASVPKEATLADSVPKSEYNPIPVAAAAGTWLRGPNLGRPESSRQGRQQGLERSHALPMRPDAEDPEEGSRVTEDLNGIGVSLPGGTRVRNDRFGGEVVYPPNGSSIETRIDGEDLGPRPDGTPRETWQPPLDDPGWLEFVERVAQRARERAEGYENEARWRRKDAEEARKNADEEEARLREARAREAEAAAEAARIIADREQRRAEEVRRAATKPQPTRTPEPDEHGYAPSGHEEEALACEASREVEQGGRGTISCAGFTPSGDVKVLFHRPDGSASEHVGKVDGEGNFDGTFTVALERPSGRWTLDLTDVSSGRAIAIPFAVLPSHVTTPIAPTVAPIQAPAPPPPPAEDSAPPEREYDHGDAVLFPKPPDTFGTWINWRDSPEYREWAEVFNRISDWITHALRAAEEARSKAEEARRAAQEARDHADDSGWIDRLAGVDDDWKGYAIDKEREALEWERKARYWEGVLKDARKQQEEMLREAERRDRETRERQEAVEGGR